MQAELAQPSGNGDDEGRMPAVVMDDIKDEIAGKLVASLEQRQQWRVQAEAAPPSGNGYGKTQTSAESLY